MDVALNAVGTIAGIAHHEPLQKMFYALDLPRLHCRRAGQRQEQGEIEGRAGERQTWRQAQESQMKYTERCEGIKASGERCKCYGVMQVNSLWYCKTHGEKELRALAMVVAMGEKPRAGERKA